MNEDSAVIIKQLNAQIHAPLLAQASQGSLKTTEVKLFDNEFVDDLSNWMILIIMWNPLMAELMKQITLLS